MGVSDDVRTLRLAVEKADKLAGFSFTKYIMDGGKFGVSGTRADDGSWKYEATGYDAEAIDAFLLTLRMFVQKRDAIGFENLEKLFLRLPIDPRRITAVQDTQREISRHLDQNSNFAVDGKQLTRREIFDVVLYGSLAHTNDNKLPIYDDWMSRPGLPQFILTEFCTIVAELYQVIRWYRTACNEAADILESQSAATPSS
jgi:hypothetical protein